MFQFHQRLKMDHFDELSLLLVTFITYNETNIISIFIDEETGVKSCHLTLSKVTEFFTIY